MEKKFNLTEYQSKFFQSEARYPAFVAAWGTGKSLTAIAKVMDCSTRFNNNLFAIFRKEFVDLRDSTIKDFEDYTGIKVNSSRDAVLSNGSTIMFRHLEELNNIQNINLGGFWIEQAEEMESDKEFVTLFGRLRRNGCKHIGMITGNTKGHNWIYENWKLGKMDNTSLVEATTFENKLHLPQDYLDSLDIIRKQRPEIYQRFVLNSWDVDDAQFVVLPESMVRKNVNNQQIHDVETKRITVADIASAGEDETVIYDMVNTVIKDQEIYSHRDLMDTVGRIQAHERKNASSLVCVDKVGEGSGVYSRLNEIYSGTEVQVYGFDGRITAPEGIRQETYKNYKTFAWFQAREYFQNWQCNIPNDEILIKQLSGMTYHFKSNGKYCLDPKDEVKEKLSQSPDRADAYIMGLDALRYAKSTVGGRPKGGYIPQRFKRGFVSGYV